MQFDGKMRFLSEDGFSLIELLIVMSIFVVVLVISSNTFTLILKQSTQQSKQTQTQMERIVGLELLRTDVGNAGFGLPWSFSNTISYSEAVTVPSKVCSGNGSTGVDPATYNDAPNGIPRAIISSHSVCINGSDYLVVKATAVGQSASSQNWTHIGAGSTTPWSWSSNNSNISNGDNVVVIEPLQGSSNVRQLVMNGSGGSTAFSTTYSNNNFSSNFVPSNPSEAFLIYDVDPNYSLRMPFNRADYYISTSNVPSSCAPNTGVLVKATVNHNDGTMTKLLPLLDCVADIYVVYFLDTNGSGVVNDYANDISTMTVDQIRNEIVEIRLYILSHEGQKDLAYTYPTSTVTVGESYFQPITFNLASTIGPGWQNYRWKVSTIAVVPKNLL